MDREFFGKLVERKGCDIVMTFEEFCNEYSNIEMLARGGQKIVFSAHHGKYGDVVIKLFFRLDDPRSLREIEIGKQFQISAVPTIYETGHLLYEKSDTLYIVEQRVNGIELRKLITDGYRFSLKEAVEFLEQSLSFVQSIENLGIVHRDIKPENIILGNDGDVYFLDFGIARVLDMPSITKTEAMIGPHTPGYAAPEQFNNLKKQIDSRSDIFSVGVVTYECITGENPFRKGAQSALDVLQRTETITPASFQIPGDTQKHFMALLSSMMGKFPSRRPKNASQALDWLNAAKATFVFDKGGD